MNARDYYQAGNLRQALATALDDVKHHPTDGGKRGFLCELLCMVGDWERADRQLEVLGQQDPEAITAVSLFRELLRAEQARQQFYTEGRLPEFLEKTISPTLALHLEASILLREKKAAEAVDVLARAEESRPKVKGTCNGEPFDDLIDLDELTSSFFEVLTSTGRYYWVPIEQVESLEFRPWERPRDLLWRSAQMTVRGNPGSEVFIPVLYAGSATDADDRICLGRMTDWRGGEGAPIRGFGQRIFLAGSEERPILELKTLSISPAAHTA